MLESSLARVRIPRAALLAMASGVAFLSFRAQLIVAFTALACWFLYDRANTLSTFYRNSPERLSRVNTANNYDIKFADRVRSCEDAFLIEEEGLAILACDAGRERYNTVMGLFLPGPAASAELFAYDYATPDLPDADSLKKIELVGFPDDVELHTLGMDYDKETSTLFITNHARDGPRIEKFRLDARKHVASYVDTIQHPLLQGPNSILALGSEELLVTNDHYFTMKQSRLLAQLETYLALPLGTVVHVNLRGGSVDARVAARVPFANGIEMFNSTVVAVSSTSRSSVLLYTLRSGGRLEYRSEVRLPFLPDNLSSAGGKLLIAGHAHHPTLATFSRTRHKCNDPAELAGATPEMKEHCESATATSWVSEWSELDGLRHIYVGLEYPTSSTFVRDHKRNVGIITGLYAKGVMVLEE